jgi:hypothetical protein
MRLCVIQRGCGEMRGTRSAKSHAEKREQHNYGLYSCGIQKRASKPKPYLHVYAAAGGTRARMGMHVPTADVT